MYTAVLPVCTVVPWLSFARTLDLDRCGIEFCLPQVGVGGEITIPRPSVYRRHRPVVRMVSWESKPRYSAMSSSAVILLLSLWSECGWPRPQPRGCPARSPASSPALFPILPPQHLPPHSWGQTSHPKGQPGPSPAALSQGVWQRLGHSVGSANVC